MNSRISRVSKQKPPKTVFLALTIVIFFSALSAADSVGFVPSYIDGSPAPSRVDSVSLSDLPQLGELSTSDVGTREGAGQASPAGVLPTHVTIDAIDLNLPIQNPDTRDIDTLDALLQKGPARYVDSAKLGQSGNVLIFAHSSHLPVVHNQMYKAFNKIPDLKAGDSITLTGADGKSYLYSVVEVKKADVNDATIDLSPVSGTKLTLVTCDTLTGKSARFVLTADFVGVVGK
jgi:LPXTG-site transpeptidase (sortase) family protein